MWEICLKNNLDNISTRIQETGLKLKARKWQLFSKKVEFLGHIVSEDGVSADPDEDPHFVASHLSLVRDCLSMHQGFQLILYMLGNFYTFVAVCADFFFQNYRFQKILSGTLS